MIFARYTVINNKVGHLCRLTQTIIVDVRYETGARKITRTVKIYFMTNSRVYYQEK